MSLERRTPLKRGGPIRQQSKKRVAERSERERVVAAVKARAGGRCEARFMVPEVKCWGPMDVDEYVLRSAGGSHLDEENCQLLCRGHHDWKHAEPILAAERGLRPFPAGYMPDLPPLS